MSQPAVRYRPIDRTTRSTASIDEQLPADHPVRVIWQYVCGLDLSDFLRPAKAVEGGPGAPIIPAQLLFALWLYSFTEGTLSSRRLAKACEDQLPYQWLCGNDPVNYHTLADFYSDNHQALRDLFVEHVAILRQQQLVELSNVTIDGRKVPAAASKDHYHREGTLQKHLQEAQAHLQQLEQELEQQPQRTPRQAAAQKRAACERAQRLSRALEVVRERRQQRQDNSRSSARPEDARASETDPDCAKMKFSDGGFGLAYNVQTVTDETSGLIVTVAVTNQGSDNGQLARMCQQVHDEQGQWPDQVMIDSGFSDTPDVEQLEKVGVQVLMPPKNERKELQAGTDPYARKRRDSDEVAQWRQRMGTDETKEAYRRRAPVAEGTHAYQWQRGWHRFRLRGLPKVDTEALWQALGQNVAKLIRWGKLSASAVRAELG